MDEPHIPNPVIPLTPAPFGLNNSEPPKVRLKPKPPLPKIVVKRVEVPSAVEGGKDASLKVDIALENSSGPVMVRQFKATGVKPFHQNDAAAQQKEENDLWEWFMSQISTVNALELQIPTNNEALSIVSVEMAVSEDQLTQIKAGGMQIYYLFYVVDEQKRPVLEFCGRIDSKSAFSYCSFHNGP